MMSDNVIYVDFTCLTWVKEVKLVFSISSGTAEEYGVRGYEMIMIINIV